MERIAARQRRAVRRRPRTEDPEGGTRELISYLNKIPRARPVQDISTIRWRRRNLLERECRAIPSALFQQQTLVSSHQADAADERSTGFLLINRLGTRRKCRQASAHTQIPAETRRPLTRAG